ncbi:MAG: hypothetical protein SH847_09450, partial [Roseiflexaceae bacterium]|nr:hypothetical protein [Roseiflexaceae bacterium]
ESWASSNLCYNYGGDCPDHDEGVLTFKEPVLLTEKPCPNNPHGNPVRWIWDGTLGRDVPICEEIPVPDGDVDIITTNICPDPEYSGAGFVQISETNKRGITAYVNIYNQAQNGMSVFSWTDNDGAALVYPKLPQGWYEVIIGVANDAQKITPRTFYLTPAKGESCVAATKKYRYPFKSLAHDTNCLDYTVEIDALGTQVVFPNAPKRGLFNGRSHVNVDFVITWPDGTVISDSVIVTPTTCPAILPRTAEGENQNSLWIFCLAFVFILTGWIGRRFVRE